MEPGIGPCGNGGAFTLPEDDAPSNQQSPARIASCPNRRTDDSTCGRGGTGPFRLPSQHAPSNPSADRRKSRAEPRTASVLAPALPTMKGRTPRQLLPQVLQPNRDQARRLTGAGVLTCVSVGQPLMRAREMRPGMAHSRNAIRDRNHATHGQPLTLATRRRLRHVQDHRPRPDSGHSRAPHAPKNPTTTTPAKPRQTPTPPTRKPAPDGQERALTVADGLSNGQSRT